LPLSKIYAVAEIAQDGSVQYIHNDILGSAVLITDATGAIVHQYEYEAFGRMATDIGTGSFETNYTYTNQEFDPESGLFYYNARYYNPRLGRFLSRDTVLGGDGDVLSRNLYIYVKNNPLRFVDPTGRTFIFERFSKEEITLFEKRYATNATGPNTQKNNLYLSERSILSKGLGPRTLLDYVLDSKENKLARAFLSNYQGADLSNYTDEDYYNHIKALDKAYTDNLIIFMMGYVGGPEAGASREASLATNSVNLQKQLAKEAQMGQVGTKIIKSSKLWDVERIVKQYGGKAEDWIKKTSDSFTAKDGVKIETHWFENTSTGVRVEFKHIYSK